MHGIGGILVHANCQGIPLVTPIPSDLRGMAMFGGHINWLYVRPEARAG